MSTLEFSVQRVISSNDLLEVFLNVLHGLSAEMLAVVHVGKTQNAKAVGVVKLLLHVPSTSLKHGSHLHQWYITQHQQQVVNQLSHLTRDVKLSMSPHQSLGQPNSVTSTQFDLYTQNPC